MSFRWLYYFRWTPPSLSVTQCWSVGLSQTAMVTFAPDQLPGYAFRGTVVSPSPGRRSQGLSQWPPVSYGRIRTWTGPEPKGCYQTIDDDLMQHVVLLVASILLSLSGLSYSPSWSITGVPRNGNSSSLEKAGVSKSAICVHRKLTIGS